MGIEAKRIGQVTSQEIKISGSALDALAFSVARERLMSDSDEEPDQDKSVIGQEEEAIQRLADTAEAVGYTACKNGGGTFQINNVGISRHPDSSVGCATLRISCDQVGCCQEGFTAAEQVIEATVEKIQAGIDIGLEHPIDAL